jgi:hypothetical protein
MIDDFEWALYEFLVHTVFCAVGVALWSVRIGEVAERVFSNVLGSAFKIQDTLLNSRSASIIPYGLRVLVHTVCM